ncbi:MAG: DUF2927 domain-containing protein [Pseudomonadota bacterium]
MRGQRQGWRFALAAAAAALLTACSPGRDAPYRATPAPQTAAFASAVPAGHTRYQNASLAIAFVGLTHDMEWGGARPHLVRYEAPVRVALEGPGSRQYDPFLARFLGFLREGTGIDIAPAAPPAEANLHVRFVPGRSFARVLPAVSCLVAPGDLAWEAFEAEPERFGGEALAAMRRLEAVTVFLPQTAPPHLVRGCLIEEIAQALGPANDLYSLGPSIFNDDAAHVWPTALDLLMLRVLYAPELETGLGREETAAGARRALDRLNPEGLAPGVAPLRIADERAFLPWRASALGVFSRNAEPGERRARAERALRLAERRAPGGAHHCVALMTLGRVLAASAPGEALAVLDEAETVCARRFGTDDIRLARIRAERAAALFTIGRTGEALAATEPLAAPFEAHAQEERLAGLYALRTALFHAMDRPAKAEAARAEARLWGAYALGEDSEALARWLGR